ncbi:MAG: DUF3854 domain-containing protein [Oscillospiraceae bacterium]|nr:DUF3854 domain-containing protein [Oscillospiraceae bacterium]
MEENKKKGKYPFGIDFVVQQDLVPLGVQLYPNSMGYSFNCPFCEKNGKGPDRHHKYAVDIYKNVGHCMRCQAGHGITGLHQALSKKSITLQEAKEDLMRRWNGLDSDVQIELSKVVERLEEENKKMLYPAPIEIRDEVYRSFLEKLTLSKAHHDDLIARGLTEEEIRKGMYKSVPSVGMVTYGKSLSYETLDALKRHRQWGIPGFYDIRSDKPKIVKCRSGYFVPVRDEFYRISGMQIRYDPLPENATEEEKERYAKYKWFASNYKEKKDGCTASGCENIHYATQLFKTPESIILTEGVLKADVASRLAGRIKGIDPVPVLGLVGVYNAENLGTELLKLAQYGLKKVVVAVDMDYREKPQVAAALEKIEKIIIGVGLQCEVFRWDPKYKGLDDYFLAVLNRRKEKGLL